MRVCDECLTAANDEGVEDDNQEKVMAEIGDMFADHLCDQRETDGEIKCRCACNS